MRVPSLTASLACAAGITLLLFSSGCRPAAPSAVPTTLAALREPAVRSTFVSAASARRVQAMPLYQQAQQACRQKQFPRAASLLEHLAASPGLSTEEIAFCRQQRELCLRPADPKAPLPAMVLASSSRQARKDTIASSSCGPQALMLACERLGVKASLPELTRAAGTTGQGTSMEGLTKAAKAVGLQAEGVQVSREALAEAQTPALAWVHYDHYITVLKIEGSGEKGTATIRDPNRSVDETIPQEKLLRMSSGYLLLLKR